MRATGVAAEPRPLASTITVSLVEVQPSTLRMLKEAATASASAGASNSAGAAASVVRTASIVAMFGASIAAPLAMPPTTKPSPRTSVSLRTVSVVRIASAAWVPPSGESAPTRGTTPCSIASIGSGMPMSPVEQTRTADGSHPRRSPTSSHVRSAWRRPASPVAAFALPLLRITAAA